MPHMVHRSKMQEEQTKSGRTHKLVFLQHTWFRSFCNVNIAFSPLPLSSKTRFHSHNTLISLKSWQQDLCGKKTRHQKCVKRQEWWLGSLFVFQFTRQVDIHIIIFKHNHRFPFFPFPFISLFYEYSHTSQNSCNA